jgi:hypothetical protein
MIPKGHESTVNAVLSEKTLDFQIVKIIIIITLE